MAFKRLEEEGEHLKLPERAAAIARLGGERVGEVMVNRIVHDTAIYVSLYSSPFRPFQDFVEEIIRALASLRLIRLEGLLSTGSISPSSPAPSDISYYVEDAVEYALKAGVPAYRIQDILSDMKEHTMKRDR